jgi:ribonuclease HII
VAKTTRDRLMISYDALYPGLRVWTHKGMAQLYTLKHLQHTAQHHYIGACSAHYGQYQSKEILNHG